VIAEIANALLDYKTARKLRIVAALRYHLLQFSLIKNEIGNHIYSARIPRGEKPAIAVKLRRLTTTRNHDIRGESNIVHSTIQVDVMSRLPNAEAKVSQVAEMIRIATSAPCYRGMMGEPGNQIFVHGCTLERDSLNTPTPSADSSTGWQFEYSQDFRITHDQATVNITTPGNSPFAQGAFELDAFANN